MKIANIVTTQSTNVSKDFNVVGSMDEIIHGLPTLIVGFDYVNKHYPDFDIMEREVEPNLYWIFKKTEKRDEFETGMYWFTKKVYSDLTQEISYIYVDFIQYSQKTLFKIVRKILNIENKISFIFGDMVYIYGENIIFGVDLKLLRYMEFDIDKLKLKIQAKSSVFLGLSDILIEDKNTVEELGIQVRYIPYLYSIRNEQNNTTSSIYIP